jgi:hypothetical protein
LDHLIKTSIASKLYYEVKQVKAEKHIEDNKKKQIHKPYTKVFGVDTTSKSRPLMIDLLRMVVNDEPEKINSSLIMDEIAGMIRTKSGKIEHGDMTHDDTVFAYLMVRYIYAYGNNLGKFFIKQKNNALITQEDSYANSIAIIKMNNDNHVRNNINSPAMQMVEEELQRKVYDYNKMIQENELNEINADKYTRMMQVFEYNRIAEDFDRDKIMNERFIKL